MVSSFFEGTSVHSVEGILAFSAFESGEHVFIAKEHSVIYVDDFFFHTALLTQLGEKCMRAVIQVRARTFY